MPAQKMPTLRDEVAKLRVIPVVVLDDADDAVPLCEALVSGGLPVAEVTFRTAAAEESIRRIAKQLPELALGAGTVLTAEQVARAADAGAQFIVTPGFNPDVVDAAIKIGMPIVPGVNNPSQVETALAAGLELLKFFPAEASGGTAMLRALGGPYGNVTFMPTGGISPKNILDYLSLPNVAACGGSWMVAPSLIAEGRFDEITNLTRKAVALTAFEN